jgi:plastocyanin
MTRRMTLIVLALVGSMVLVITVAPPDSGVRKDAETTATPSPLTTTLSDPDAFDVSETLSAAADSKPQTVEAEVGDKVEIIVEGSVIDSVALGDLSMEDVEADVPARFELLADTPGTYPLVLVNEDRRIGTLEIR